MIQFVLWMIVLAGLIGAISKTEERPVRIIFALIGIASLVAIITTPYIVR
jgi:ABC-type sulfate transport system permease subunit